MNSATMFRANDDCTFIIGNLDEADYARNISFHGRGLSGDQYGGGMAVWGGNFYQTAENGQGGFLDVSRRVMTVQDAVFYVLPGQSVFTDNNTPSYTFNGLETVASKNVIKNCSFYGTDATAILTSKKSAPLKFENCTFYGLSASAAGEGTGSVTANDSNTFENAITYSTIT